MYFVFISKMHRFESRTKKNSDLKFQKYKIVKIPFSSFYQVNFEVLFPAIFTGENTLKMFNY